MNKFDDDVESDNASILTDASLAFRCRIIKFKKISLYHEKITKKHIDYKRNCFTTFRLTSKDYSLNLFKNHLCHAIFDRHVEEQLIQFRRSSFKLSIYFRAVYDFSAELDRRLDESTIELCVVV